MALTPRFQMIVARAAMLIPGRADKLAEAELLPAIESATLLLQREVQIRTPVGVTGHTRSSIQSSVEKIRGGVATTFRGKVTSALPHILYVEEDTRPHWAPIRPLKRWARRKLGNERLAYAIQWQIARRGTKGKHMFRDAHLQTRDRIERMLTTAVARWRQRMGE
jgi:hypothetical protein